MKKVIGAFIGCAYLLTATKAGEYCYLENEVLACCKNPCEPTCQEPHRKPCPTFACQPGCVCQAGTIRDEISGKCVSPRYCPTVCPVNEVPNDCRDVCEPTCQNQKEFQCIFQNKKCVCKPGLLRHLTSGKCVAPNQCPNECGKNEEWNLCTNTVGRKTCQRPFPAGVFYPQVCRPGCECINGYIWDEHSKKCVPENQCPKVCGINAEWKQCSDIRCKATCRDPTPKLCPKICIPGCSCKEGFIWDEQVKQCVLPTKCSKYCGENQEWRECSDQSCRETCQNSHPKVCRMMCVPGCSCKKGYIWDENYKKCVCREQCSKVCDKNAEWQEFLPTHVPTCQTLTQSQSSNCFDTLFFSTESGCICKKGYVLEEFSQKCVRPQDCPRGSGTTANITVGENTQLSTTATQPETTTITTTTTVEPTTTTTAQPETTIITTTTTAETTTTNATTTTTA